MCVFRIYYYVNLYSEKICTANLRFIYVIAKLLYTNLHMTHKNVQNTSKKEGVRLHFRLLRGVPDRAYNS